MKDCLRIYGTNSFFIPGSHSFPASGVSLCKYSLLKIRLSSFHFFYALKKSLTFGQKLLCAEATHYTNSSTMLILYIFVFVYWNIRTKLTNPVSENINSRTFQLRLSVQSSPSHRCYNFKIPDQKLLDRTAAVTGNTK